MRRNSIQIHASVALAKVVAENWMTGANIGFFIGMVFGPGDQALLAVILDESAILVTIIAVIATTTIYIGRVLARYKAAEAEAQEQSTSSVKA